MDPLVFVIFGASGDLARRKLIPAIFRLHTSGYLSKKFAILGVSRSEYTDEAFRDKVFLKNDLMDLSGESKEDIESFAKKLFYQPIDTSEPADYEKVKTRLNQLDEQFQNGHNYVFYLSTPPELYETIPACLAHHGLSDKSKGWKRLVIEKPFGYDKDSAKILNKKLLEYFEEDQIYRIDHYLGKETVQNLLVTRFSNGIFEPLWNRNFIDHIQITSAESIGVEKRGGYYDKSGALRDMFQNHLLQIVAHVAMEPPNSADARAIRNEKVKLFQSIRPIKESEVEQYVVRGQYTESKIRGEAINGYREEEGVPENSKTETYVGLKFFIDNWRWADVPFYVRSGKRLPTKVTEVVVNFKSPPHALFHRVQSFEKPSNQLVIRIQPHEGLALQFGMKIPGAGFNVKNVDMDFHYNDLVDTYVPEAYERLILDVIKGDATLYARGDSVEAAWDFVDPILNAWENQPDLKLFGYPAGTWGPEAADLLVNSNGGWRNPCKNLTNMNVFCEL